MKIKLGGRRARVERRKRWRERGGTTNLGSGLKRSRQNVKIKLGGRHEGERRNNTKHEKKQTKVTWNATKGED